MYSFKNYNEEVVVISTNLQLSAHYKFLLSGKTGRYWIVILCKPSGGKDVDFTALEKDVNKVSVHLTTNGVCLVLKQSLELSSPNQTLKLLNELLYVQTLTSKTEQIMR